MDRELATHKKRAYIRGFMRERDLLASLQSIGVQIPALSYGGALVDGRKKALMCAETGIFLPIHTAETLREACSILWTRHPARALELAGTTSVLELAKLCGTTASAIAHEIKANKPKKSHHKKRVLDDQPYRALKASSKMIKRLILFEPELYAYAKEAAAEIGHRNVNRLVRDAVWAKVALVVRMAPQFQPRRVQPPNGIRARRRRTG